jgi:Glu-tRNA(Gln) amidotransferase subunit E-like FAD-binding protein
MRPTPWARFQQFGAWGVPPETTEFLIRRGGVALVDAVVGLTGVDGLVAAIEIGQKAKALRRRGIPVGRLGEAEWVQVFDLFTGGRIPREAIQPVAGHMAMNPGTDAASAMAALGFGLQPREVWADQLAGLSMEDYRIDLGDSDGKRLRFLAGRAMRQLLGKAPAREVAEYLKTRLTQEAVR